MDALDKLKEDWKRQADQMPKLSFDQLYSMLSKKSSSLVKWIFIISILEFFVWASIEIIMRFTGALEVPNSPLLQTILTLTSFFYYAVLLYFIIRFYQNYATIKTTDSVKVLMANILKTRATVKQYIWVNISLFVVFVGLASGVVLYEDVNQIVTKGFSVFYFITIVVLLVLCFVIAIYVFYRLLYGFLLKRLKENYKELEKIEN